MKKQKNMKQARKSLKKSLKQARKSLRKTKNKISRRVKSKTNHMYKKKKRNSRKNKKKTKFVMKGGAIPFSELHPSNVLDNLTHGFKSSLSGGYLSDYPQHVPNNLPHNVNSSVTHQPYLEGEVNSPVVVVGKSPDDHFAST